MEGLGLGGLTGLGGSLRDKAFVLERWPGPSCQSGSPQSVPLKTLA